VKEDVIQQIKNAEDFMLVTTVYIDKFADEASE